jgi:small-conductance mechanosensitive channel
MTIPPNFYAPVVLAIQALLILLGALVLDRMIQRYLHRKSASAIFGTLSHGLVRGIARGFVYAIAALILLDLFGISITPILASLGIGSLAVALALQDTLGNFFAGIYVAIDKPVVEGDFVKLETGQEGYVTDVGWRSTRIRMLSNNSVIVPNSKLMGSVITNYYMPTKLMGMTIDLGVSYDSDLRKVERVTVDVIREIMRTVPGGVPETEPFIRFHTFAESSVNFSAVMQVKEFTDNYLIKHEFIKALHERYRKEGIVIPYPTRTVHTVAGN